MRALIFAAVLLIASTARATVEDYYTLVDSAEFYIGAHEWARAEEFIQKALRNEPDNQNTSLLLSNLATVQRYQGKNREALKNYNVALFMTPNSVTLLKNRASLFLDMDSTERAYADYNRVLEIDGYDIEALYNRGMLSLDKKMMEDSKADFQKIKDISPNSYFAYNGFAIWYKANGNYAKAIENYGVIIKERPSVNALANRAECFLELKQFNNAEADIRNALTTDPRNGYLYLLRAKLNRLRFETDAAQRDVALAKEYGVDDAVVKAFLGLED